MDDNYFQKKKGLKFVPCAEEALFCSLWCELNSSNNN